MKKKEKIKQNRSKNKKNEQRIKTQYSLSKTKLASSTYLAFELGFSLSIPIVGGVLLGRWLDTQFTTKPILTLILLLGGVIISFLNLFTIVKRFIK